MKSLFKKIGILVIVSFLFATVFALDLKGKIEAIDLQAKTITVAGQVYQIDEMTFWEQGIATDVLAKLKVGDLIDLTFNQASAAGPIRVIKFDIPSFTDTTPSMDDTSASDTTTADTDSSTGPSLDDVVNSPSNNSDDDDSNSSNDNDNDSDNNDDRNNNHSNTNDDNNNSNDNDNNNDNSNDNDHSNDNNDHY